MGAMVKKLQIGQRPASRICQMSSIDRLAFIAEGLPIIHASAMGFWSAAAELREKPREAEVLEGFAKEAEATARAFPPTSSAASENRGSSRQLDAPALVTTLGNLFDNFPGEGRCASIIF